jgi:hypothetical protein
MPGSQSSGLRIEETDSPGSHVIRETIDEVQENTRKGPCFCRTNHVP